MHPIQIEANKERLVCVIHNDSTKGVTKSSRIKGTEFFKQQSWER